MVVGVCRLRLALPGNSSLKGKRQVVRAVTDRLRGRFNVAVAEVAAQDDHRSAVIGITVVANEAAFVESCLDRVINAVDRMELAPIVETEKDLVQYGDDLVSETDAHWEPEDDGPAFR